MHCNGTTCNRFHCYVQVIIPQLTKGRCAKPRVDYSSCVRLNRLIIVRSARCMGAAAVQRSEHISCIRCKRHPEFFRCDFFVLFVQKSTVTFFVHFRFFDTTRWLRTASWSFTELDYRILGSVYKCIVNFFRSKLLRILLLAQCAACALKGLKRPGHLCWTE